MKFITKALMGAAAVAMPAAANASITVTWDDSTPIPAINDFQGNLNGLGLFNLDTVGATMTLNTNAVLMFEFLGTESGYSDTFTANSLGGPITYTENTGLMNYFAAPILIGSGNFNAGNLAGLLNFTTNGVPGAPATVGQAGFGIFLPRVQSGAGSSTGNVFYIGYDDHVQASNPDDDNHDDFIVRVTVLPEPGTWAMMLIGFGAVGYSMRKTRKAKAIPQVA